MRIAALLFKYAPNWAVCRELKLLYANNRLIEAFNGKDLTLMALTKLEKFALKRAFKELRRNRERERLKQWAVTYAITGRDSEHEPEPEQLDLPYARSVPAQNLDRLTYLEQMRAQQLKKLIK